MDHTGALDDIYDAALSSDGWPDALDRLARELGGVSAVLIPRFPSDLELGFPSGRWLEDLMTHFIKDGWYLQDLRAVRGWDRFERGEDILVDHDLVTPAEHARLPFFQEFFVGHGVPWWGGMGFSSGGRQWCLSLVRSDRQGPFLREDLEPSIGILPHLRRAVTLASAFRTSVEAQRIELAESLGLPLLLLDRAGRVRAATSAAEPLLGGPLSLRSGRLHALHPDRDRRLQAIVGAAIAAVGPSAQPGHGIAMVERPDGGRPVMVEAMTLPARARDVFTRDVALVYLRDLGAARPADPERLRIVFGLTQAEAEVARLVAAGEDLRTVAERRRIAYETARVQLRSIFSKTGTVRQSELAALVSRFGSTTGG